MIPEHIRHYIYGLAVNVIAVLAAYGILGPDEVPVWTAVAIAVLGLGTNVMALRNTTKLPPPPGNFGP